MNEEELRRMVERARDAEGLAVPPPDLVGEARAASRSRRRWQTAGVGVLAVAAVVAAVALPRLVGGGDEPNLVAGQDELTEHGGPCPAVLPVPTDDDGYGFGTRERAEGDPRFLTPDSAWVCQYSRQGDRWALQQTARRLDDALLTAATEALDGVAAGAGPQACTDDLGPRWMLVTAAAGDLTGAVVDDYGCREVRLTDDPFVTAPGDPQGGGTVPGVLTAGDGFDGLLEEWWDTSADDGQDVAAPQELRVTCTDAGPQVETTTVAASPAGVVLVVDSTMSKGAYLTYTSDGLSGGDDLRQIDSPATYAFPPGTLTLGCASPPDMDDVAPVEIEVMDPNGYWRTETLADFGCEGSGQPSWAVGNGTGSTAEEAVDALLQQFADGVGSARSDYTAEPAPTGYSGSESQTWIGLKDGSASFSIVVTGSGSSFAANPDVLC